MKQVIAGLNPANYKQHALHNPARDWPETNCYVDLWIEVLASLGLSAEAMLGFSLTQDFEGDQFTFFKTPLEDIEHLFGINVTELAIFDKVERHVITQIERGRLTLVEVDSFWLPDTRGISYRTSHSKTTIAINELDAASKRMNYFHNSGFFEVAEDDYDGIFGLGDQTEGKQALFPYVEFAKFISPRKPNGYDCLQVLNRHLARRPHINPFVEWQKKIPAHFDDLMQRPPDYFHIYAFNTLRQFGANYELLSAHLEWLSKNSNMVFATECNLAKSISTSAKTLQFQLARAMAKRKPQGFVEMVTPIADNYAELMRNLEARMGAKRAA